MNMNNLKQKLLSIGSLIWLGIGVVYWQLSPHISTYSDRGMNSSIYQAFNGITIIGIDLVVLLLGRTIKNKRANFEWIILQGWLNTFVLGSLVCLVVGLSSNNDISKDYLNALFPFLRNTYPIIFGSFIGIVISCLIKTLDRIKIQFIISLILALFTTGMFVAPNAYGWTIQTSTLFYALLFVVGWFADDLLMTLTKEKWLIIGCISLIVNLILQYSMPIFSIDGSNNDRFTTVASILPVLIGLSLLKIFSSLSFQTLGLRFVFSFLVLIENTGVISYLTNNIRNQIGGSSLLNGLLTITFIIVAMVLASIWGKLSKLKEGKFDKAISSLIQISLKKQLHLAIQKLRIRRQLIFTFAFTYILSFVMMSSMNDSFTIYVSGNAYNIFAYILGQRELLLILTSLIIFSEIRFVQVIIRRYWVSITIVSAFNIIFMIAGVIKAKARQEPILPSDLSEVNGNLLQMVNSNLLVIVTGILFFAIILVVFLERKYPIRIQKNWKRQIFYILLLPTLLLSSLFWNHDNSPLGNFMSSVGDQPTFYSQLDGARRNGPTIQFLNNIDIQIMKKPHGYSKQEMMKLVKKYQLQAQSINKTRENNLSDQTIIFNLSESFANPARVPGIKLKNNPVPYITRLEKQYGGLMMSSSYGGGTANIEFMTLTGFSMSNFMPTLSIAYTQLVPRLAVAPSIVESFKYASTIHPYYGGFYSRIEAYKKFGFNKFVYLGSKYKIKHQSYIDKSPYLSDKTAYSNALDQIKGRSGGQFINLITMQNHMPFDEHYYNYLKKYKARRVSSGTDIDSLNEYLTGIHYTDDSVKRFIKQIDQINKPITIVFYGDHLPGIYGNNFSKDGKKLHETDYFIYSNKYARQHGCRKLKQNVNYTNPNNFIAMVAKQTNSKVNWYQALLTKVYEQMPIDSLQTRGNDEAQFINQKGKTIKEKNLTIKQKQLWHDYQLVQYDITSGHQYTAKYFNR